MTRRFVLRLGILIGAFLLTAVILEALARLHEPSLPERRAQGAEQIDPVMLVSAGVNFMAPGLVEPDPTFGYRLRPAITLPPYTINAAGYRGRVVDLTRPHGAYRVLVLGSSTTFGWGVPEGDAYPGVLEGMLNRRCTPSLGTQVEVINAGVPGYGSTQLWLVLKERWLAYAPDVVIVMPELGDLMVGAFGSSRLQVPALFSPVTARLRPLYEAALQKSAFARWYARQLQSWAMWRTTRASAATAETPIARATAATRDSFDGIHRLTAPRGIPMVIVAYPGLLQSDATAFPGTGTGPAQQAYVPSPLAGGLEAMREVWQRWAARHDVAWVDPRGSFRAHQAEGGLHLGDGLHFTRAGHQLVAEAIYDVVFKGRCEG